MKVKDLISLLNAFNPDHDVVLSSDFSGSEMKAVHDCDLAMYVSGQGYCSKEKIYDLKASMEINNGVYFKGDTVVIFPKN